jgi:hypothetical protein
VLWSHVYLQVIKLIHVKEMGHDKRKAILPLLQMAIIVAILTLATCGHHFSFYFIPLPSSFLCVCVCSLVEYQHWWCKKSAVPLYPHLSWWQTTLRYSITFHLSSILPLSLSLCVRAVLNKPYYLSAYSWTVCRFIDVSWISICHIFDEETSQSTARGPHTGLWKYALRETE